MNIKSILHPTERCYALADDWSGNWDRKGNSALSLNLTQFETYGDGDCQHSPSYCVQFCELTDALMSVTAAMLADPLNDIWRKWYDVQSDHTDMTLRWAMTVKYVEGKEQFYSVSQCKVTRSNKRFDKRWEKVESWCDGTPASAFRLLYQEHMGFLARIILCDRLRDMAGQEQNWYQNWEQLFKPATELTGDWHNALQAFRYALTAVKNLEWAKGTLECAEHNSRPKESVAA